MPETQPTEQVKQIAREFWREWEEIGSDLIDNATYNMTPKEKQRFKGISRTSVIECVLDRLYGGDIYKQYDALPKKQQKQALAIAFPTNQRHFS